MKKIILFISIFFLSTTGFSQEQVPYDEMLTESVVTGFYANRRGDSARVVTYVTEEATLFSKAQFDIEIKFKNTDGEKASLSINTKDLTWSNERRAYFQDAAGIIKLLKTKRGDYTLYLNIETSEFSDRSFLKKIEQEELTEELWLSLDTEKRSELVEELSYNTEGLDLSYKGFKIISYEDLNGQGIGAYKELQESVMKLADDYVDRDSIDQMVGADVGYGLIGGIDYDVYLLLSSDNKLIASNVLMYQYGVQNVDATWDDEFYYDTLEEAEAAGFEDTDVKWNADVQFISADEISESSDVYFEWSGH